MTRVAFLAHSGFLVELESVSLLFDWWKGALPPLPEGKPLYVFASHRHPDHFKPDIFALDGGSREVRFLLSHDIRLDARHMDKWGISQETAEKCLILKGNQTASLPCVCVETLPSTDEGVAFVVECEGKTLYHAGDLNWWHWEGEDRAWNRNMEANFKRYLEPLRGRHIDLAFAPLDPRQEGAAGWGLRYLLELADVDRVIPMHQWEDYRPTEAFLAEFPWWREKILPVSALGQTWELA